MKNYYDNFYKKSSKKFKKYEFHGRGKLAAGEKPDFFAYIKKFADKKFKALDLGCESGELTLRISPFFKKVIGIDPFEDYIKTARRQKKEVGIENVIFTIADGKNLPFKDESFDVIFSSRGPLSADIKFMKEGLRILRKGGVMIEETIGEKDKLELKKIFGRGQNYSAQETKIKFVKKLLKKCGMKFIESKYFLYYQIFPSLNTVIEILERAPIIPKFDKIKDKLYLEKVNKKIGSSKGIKLSSHRLHWAARK